MGLLSNFVQSAFIPVGTTKIKAATYSILYIFRTSGSKRYTTLVLIIIST